VAIRSVSKQSSDASGERDYEDLESWGTKHDGAEHLDGEWLRAVDRRPTQNVQSGPLT